MSGDLDTAHQRHIESSEAHKKASHPAIYVIGRELEAFRIDIKQGKVAVRAGDRARAT